jgi:hypothetical protein
MTVTPRLTLDHFKQIFRDHLQSFLCQSPECQRVSSVIEKMLGCGDPRPEAIANIGVRTATNRESLHSVERRAFACDAPHRTPLYRNVEAGVAGQD